MPDATRITHAARSYNNVKAGKFRDGLALVNRLGEAQVRRVQQAAKLDFWMKARRVSAKDFGGSNRKVFASSEEMDGVLSAIARELGLPD